MPEPPPLSIYDITTDSYRPLTQRDADLFSQLHLAYGKIRTKLEPLLTLVIDNEPARQMVLSMLEDHAAFRRWVDQHK